MKRDKHGRLHDKAGNFVSRRKRKPVDISLGSQINIALFVVLGIDASVAFCMYVWPNVVSTFQALGELLK